MTTVDPNNSSPHPYYKGGTDPAAVTKTLRDLFGIPASFQGGITKPAPIGSAASGLVRFFERNTRPDARAVTYSLVNGPDIDLTRANDQANFEALGELFQADAEKIRASCVQEVDTRTPEEKKRDLADRARAATRACAFMDFKK